jgi:hypothetical protein
MHQYIEWFGTLQSFDGQCYKLSKEKFINENEQSKRWWRWGC